MSKELSENCQSKEDGICRLPIGSCKQCIDMQPVSSNKPEMLYEVIADYPHSPYKVGDMVKLSETLDSFHCTTTYQYSEFDGVVLPFKNYFSRLSIDKYPHLFRKL